MSQPEIDTDRVDDAVLALMYLTLHAADRTSGSARAWKSFDWAAMARLHEKGLICDPGNKAKSVMLTADGVRRSEALFCKLFAQRNANAGPARSAAGQISVCSDTTSTPSTTPPRPTGGAG